MVFIGVVMVLCVSYCFVDFRFFLFLVRGGFLGFMDLKVYYWVNFLVLFLFNYMDSMNLFNI